jgi:hypothetical protein
MNASDFLDGPDAESFLDDKPVNKNVMNHTENSSRCGKGNCIHYNKHNLESKCKIYDNM